VVRAKDNFRFKIIESRKVDKSIGLRCDQTIKLVIYKSKKQYPEKLRRIKYYDSEKDITLVFLTNNFEVEALEVAVLYKNRWQVELFFKWIKQNLQIKTIWCHSENAVKIHIWELFAPTW
jgi:IS4 transposase